MGSVHQREMDHIEQVRAEVRLLYPIAPMGVESTEWFVYYREPGESFQCYCHFRHLRALYGAVVTEAYYLAPDGTWDALPPTTNAKEYDDYAMGIGKGQMPR